MSEATQALLITGVLALIAAQMAAYFKDRKEARDTRKAQEDRDEERRERDLKVATDVKNAAILLAVETRNASDRAQAAAAQAHQSVLAAAAEVKDVKVALEVSAAEVADKLGAIHEAVSERPPVPLTGGKQERGRP